MKNIIFSLLTIFFYVNAFGNPPDSTLVVEKSQIYHVNRALELSIIGVGLASDYFAIPRIKGKDSISDAEINNLNPDLLNPIDRWGLHQNPADQKLYRHISDYGLAPLVLLPAFLLLDKKIKKDWFDLMLMYTEGHSITFSFYNYSFLGPTFQDKYRPMTYYTEFTLKERENGNNRNSFYSGHVASATFTSFFMAKVYYDYHPEIGAKKYLLYTAALIPGIAMSYCRVKALDHFVSDDAVGLLLGASLGVIIPALHKVHAKNISVGLYTPRDGMGLTFRWALSSQKTTTDYLVSIAK